MKTTEKSMNIIRQDGIKKKSFELNNNGGQIWCEHLDGMGAYKDEVIAIFLGDVTSFSRPSVSSFMIIDLDETDITEKIAKTIVTEITEAKKIFRKIAFVGVDKCRQKSFDKIKKRNCS